MGGQISSGQVPGKGCVRSSLWPGYPPAQGLRGWGGSACFSHQGATTACSREQQFNFLIQCEISGFYFHSMACIGVILPREADGLWNAACPSWLLWRVGCALAATCMPRPGTRRNGPRKERWLAFSFGFFVPAVQRDPGCPGEGSSLPTQSLLVSGLQLCSQASCEILLNPWEEMEEEDPLAFVHVALVERRPLQCPFAFELINKSP